MTQPNPQAERQSVFPVQPTSTTRRPAKSQSNTTRAAPTKQKRKRGVSDPADALEMVAKRLRGGTQAPNGVEGTYGSIIPKFKDLAPAPTTITTTTTTTQATVTEHSYGPTAPRIAGQASDRTSLAMKTLATQNLHNVRLAPFGSKEYDLAIRTKDRVAWAQWANDLHKEIRSLRYVQDLGPYTMGVIAMMTQDGVWPTGNEVDVGDE